MLSSTLHDNQKTMRWVVLVVIQFPKYYMTKKYRAMGCLGCHTIFVFTHDVFFVVIYVHRDYMTMQRMPCNTKTLHGGLESMR